MLAINSVADRCARKIDADPPDDDQAITNDSLCRLDAADGKPARIDADDKPQDYGNQNDCKKEDR